MKNILLLFIGLFVYSQNYKVEYDEIYLLPESSKKNLSDVIISNYETPKEHVLLINEDDLCLYKKQEKLGQTNSVESIGNYTTNFIVTNPSEKYIYQDITIEHKNYKVKSPLKLSNRWQNHRETKTINGILATKLTLESINDFTEVWYAKDIKTKCGPSKILGYPGLVLEVFIKPKSDDKPTVIYKMKNIDFLKDDSELKPYFSKISNETITQEEFNEIYKAYQKNVQEMYGGDIDKD